MAEIPCRSTLGIWRRCPGVCNPADLPLQGINGENLPSNKLWWGPGFLLLSEDKWPESNIPPASNIVEAELVKDPSLNTHIIVANNYVPSKDPEAIIIDCNKFGTFQKLL